MSEITTYERYRLGQAYVADGDGRSAARVLEPAVEAEPTSAALWLLLARAYFASARLRRAEAAFERVLEVDPTDDYARFGLGRTLERQSRHEEALAQYRIAMALSPDPDYLEALHRVEAGEPLGGSEGESRGEAQYSSQRPVADRLPLGLGRCP
jgi:tetratricopeptide (TPR) repeat protein